MDFLDLTLPTAAENLALDEALLQRAAADGAEILRCWEWRQPAVVLGAGCRLAEDVDETACQAAGVPILRRASGGGTVLLGRGCLVYSLILCLERTSALRGIAQSYCHILDRVRTALADLVPGVRIAGMSDLAVEDRKFSGNSQQRKRGYLLHHGTLLYHFDLASVSRYLRLPARQPDYRRGRDHADFLMNLPTDSGDLTARLRRAWHATVDVTEWPQELTQRLSEEKYRAPAWIRRR